MFIHFASIMKIQILLGLFIMPIISNLLNERELNGFVVLVWIKQNVYRSGAVLFESSVTVVAITSTGRPTRLPAEFRLIQD